MSSLTNFFYSTFCRFIKQNFVYWSNVVSPYDEEDLSGEEDVDEVQDHLSDDDEEMGRSLNDREEDFDDFENSMNKMSITPRNSFKYSMGGDHKMIPMKMPARIRPSTSPE